MLKLCPVMTASLNLQLTKKHIWLITIQTYHSRSQLCYSETCLNRTALGPTLAVFQLYSGVHTCERDLKSQR